MNALIFHFAPQEAGGYRCTQEIINLLTKSCYSCYSCYSYYSR